MVTLNLTEQEVEGVLSALDHLVGVREGEAWMWSASSPRGNESHARLDAVLGLRSAVKAAALGVTEEAA